jgi:Domain of unknown function (DUF4833)
MTFLWSALVRGNGVRSGDRRGRNLFPALVLFLLAAAASAVEDTPCPPHLFVIERSLNANIVVYDANRGPDGRLVVSQPVKAYWILNAKQGQRQELTALERSRAYGLTVAPRKRSGRYTVVLKARPGWPILVRVRRGCPIAIAKIDGHRAVVRRLFVKTTEKIFIPHVDYVEIFGEDLETGAPLYEKYIPKN